MREISLPQAEALVERLTSPQAFFAALQSAAIYYKGKIAQYPGERHDKQPFKTDKQRRGFFAKLRAGEIKVPYPRGGMLGKLWHTVPEDGYWTQRVGNPQPYAGIVQGAEKQSFYHKKTGWKSVPQVWREEEKSIRTIFANHFRKLTGFLG